MFLFVIGLRTHRDPAETNRASSNEGLENGHDEHPSKPYPKISRKERLLSSNHSISIYCTLGGEEINIEKNIEKQKTMTAKSLGSNLGNV